jgi:hypothetical protein
MARRELQSGLSVAGRRLERARRERRAREWQAQIQASRRQRRS